MRFFLRNLLFILSELNNVISPETYYFAIGGRESFCNSKEYQQMFLVLNDLLDDKKSFYEQLHDTNNSDLWGGENNNNYQGFVSACVCKELNIQRPKDNYYEWQESMKFYLPAISLDIKLFAQLSNNFKNASGLLSELHQSAIVNAFQQRMPDPDLVLTSVSKITSFDFAQLTWEQIFYLRRHKFTKEFRIKVKE